MDTSWPQIRNILQKSLNPGLFRLWITPLDAEVKGNQLTLVAPNAFVASWVKDRLLAQVEEAAAVVFGHKAKVGVRVNGNGRANGSNGTGTAPGADNGVEPAPRPAPAQLGLPALYGGAALSPAKWRFSFEDFVVGPSNRLANAAAMGLCDGTFPSDCLYISSTSGLGKTHLVQAVGQRMCQEANTRRPRVECLSAEEFATRLILAIKAREVERFKARYRDNVDLLLLEDIHFFQGKGKLQDELLCTLKALRAKGSKVVVTSSFLPRELRDVDDHLASRFSSGFLASIDKPDFDTRRRILERKAGLFQVALPGQVTDLLADRVRTDVRRLEACLHNLALKARLLGREITEELAWQVLSELGLEDGLYGMDRIVDMVCRSHGLKPEQLCSKSRKQQIVTARNTAFYLARKHTDMTLQEIGQRFNRRHSTVLKGITNVERHLNRETPLGRQISRTIQLIGDMGQAR